MKRFGAFTVCLLMVILMTVTTFTESKVIAAVSKTPEIVWVFPGGEKKDLKKVEAEINKYIRPKIGVTLKLMPIGWESWFSPETAKINCDIMFTAGWSGFETDAAAGRFLDIYTLLDSVAPKTKALLGKNMIKGALRGGKLYALPVMKDNGLVPGVKLRKDLVTKYKINTSKIKKLEDLEPVLKQVKAKEKGVRILELGDQNFSGFLNLDPLGGLVLPGVLDKNMKVVDIFSLPQIKTFFNTIYKYGKAGYIYDTKDPVQDENQGSAFAILKGSMTLFDERNQSTKKGLEWVNVPLGKPYLDTAGVTGGMNAIMAGSKNYKKALALMELVYTDQYLNNLMNYGIQGVHYVKKSKNVIDFPKGINQQTSKYYPDQRLIFCNMYLNYSLGFEDPAKAQKMKSLNDSAIASKGLGFWFDPGKIQEQADMCVEVYNKMVPDLLKGKVDPNVQLPALIQELRDAGAADVVSEKQRQLDAWLAASGSTKK